MNKLRKLIQWFSASLFVAFGSGGLAANVVWSMAVPISGDKDVCKLGVLERACKLGENVNYVVINSVTFAPFVPSLLQADSVSDGKTTFAVSRGGDCIQAESNTLDNGVTGLSADYRLLLRSGLHGRSSACALILDGLTAGKTYLIQLWVNDSRGSLGGERFSDGETTSSKVRFNTTSAYGGVGQYLSGLFVADSDRQTITIMPEDGDALINAFQLRAVEREAKPAMASQPSAVGGYAGDTLKLSLLAVGAGPLTYQWQTLSRGKPKNLFDDAKFAGSSTRELTLRNIAADDAGSYRVLVSNATGFMTSEVAKISVLLAPTNQLINVDFNCGSSPTYRGDGVLVGSSGYDIWNGIAANSSFQDIALVDSTGAKTPVTLTLSKSVIDGYINRCAQNHLLADYSPAPAQEVSINNLEPFGRYHLVVYSIGQLAHEGGVFSGAVAGVVYGGNADDHSWANRFWPDTNYIENPFAVADKSGRLKFNVVPTTAIKDRNCVLNGLQLARASTNALAPSIHKQPLSTAVYENTPATLTVTAIGPPSERLTYQWQKLKGPVAINLADDGVAGATDATLVFSKLTSSLEGAYRVIIGDSFGAVTSEVATVSLKLHPTLINVDIKNGSSPAYAGGGLIAGGDYWNGIDGRQSFQNIPLADDKGNPTLVTMSLLKDRIDSFTSSLVTNGMLQDYSVGTSQTVVLKNLEPAARYWLVVYSFGALANEGGVFSGAVTGTARGWEGSPTGPRFQQFELGRNYVENRSARTDNQGTLTFTVVPVSTVISNGCSNSDINGLQILKAIEGVGSTPGK